MKRSQVLLAVLAGILLVAIFYFLLFQPTRDEVAALEVQITAEQDQQASLNQEIARLRAVREEAPEVEAQLAAAEAIVPREAALPSALRQLQLAADESGITLQTISTSRPAQIVDAPEGLSSLVVNLQLSGGYFQIVDFLRRTEDPAITPRGVTWSNATLAIEEYPDLSVALSGSMYALISTPVPPETEAVVPDGEAEPVEGEPVDGTPAEDADPDAEPDDVEVQ